MSLNIIHEYAYNDDIVLIFMSDTNIKRQLPLYEQMGYCGQFTFGQVDRLNMFP